MCKTFFLDIKEAQIFTKLMGGLFLLTLYRPSKNLSDTDPTPFRHLPDTLQIPLRHLSDTLQKQTGQPQNFKHLVPFLLVKARWGLFLLLLSSFFWQGKTKLTPSPSNWSSVESASWSEVWQKCQLEGCRTVAKLWNVRVCMMSEWWQDNISSAIRIFSDSPPPKKNYLQ